MTKTVARDQTPVGLPEWGFCVVGRSCETMAQMTLPAQDNVPLCAINSSSQKKLATGSIFSCWTFDAAAWFLD